MIYRTLRLNDCALCPHRTFDFLLGQDVCEQQARRVIEYPEGSGPLDRFIPDWCPLPKADALAAVTAERDDWHNTAEQNGTIAANFKRERDAALARAEVAEAKIEAAAQVLTDMRSEERNCAPEDVVGAELRWAISRLADALASTGPSLRQRVETLIGTWKTAYPKDVFPSLDDDERTSLGSLVDRVSAGMARHMTAKLEAIVEDSQASVS